jgi:hypothetical protein
LENYQSPGKRASGVHFLVEKLKPEGATADWLKVVQLACGRAAI